MTIVSNSTNSAAILRMEIKHVAASGAGSNSKVEGHKVQTAGATIFDVPVHFSVVPLHVGGHNKK